MSKFYIVHPGTKTVIAADECVMVGSVLPEQLAEKVEGDGLPEGVGHPVPNPWLVLSFEPTAIREHFESRSGYDTESSAMDGIVRAMTDDQLVDIADRAMVDDRLYEAFHEVLEYAVQDFIDGEREAEEGLA